MKIRVEVKTKSDCDDMIEIFVGFFSFHRDIYNKGIVDVFRVLLNVYKQGNNDKALQFYFLSYL